MDIYQAMNEAAAAEEERRGYPLQEHSSSDDDWTPTASGRTEDWFGRLIWTFDPPVSFCRLRGQRQERQ